MHQEHKVASINIIYIVRCLNDLDDAILAGYLTKLGILPDSRAMEHVERQYDNIVRSRRYSKTPYTLKDVCNGTLELHVEIPIDIITAKVFFYHINSKHLDKPFYEFPKFFSNVINLEKSLLDKNNIYDNIKKYNSKVKVNSNYFIETFTLTFTKADEKKFEFPGNYITRPVSGFAGSDIFYIQSPEQRSEVISYYIEQLTEDRKRQKYKPTDIIVSKIITDLLLFKSRKCHLRIYYMVAVLEDEISCFILDIGEILTAKQNYNLEIPFTKEVHNTHGYSTDADYFFPEDLTPDNISSLRKGRYDELNIDTILEGIREIGKCISNIVNSIYGDKPKSLLFENQKNGYYIYGLDILVRNNLEPVLVECNNQPSLISIIDNKELSEILYGWINETILEPLFKHPGHATEHARKHRTYIALDK
jgi:hypothetical protein